MVNLCFQTFEDEFKQSFQILRAGASDENVGIAKSDSSSYRQTKGG